MENFAPEAPNIWAGIEQGVQANTAANTASITKTISSKLIITIAKITTIIAIPTGIFTYFTFNEKGTKIENKSIESTISVPSAIKTDEIKASKTASIKTLKPTTSFKILDKISKASLVSKPHEKINNINESATSKSSIVLSTSEVLKDEKDEIISPLNHTETNNYNEEILVKKEVENIEENETKGEIIVTENAIGLRTIPNVFTPNNDGIDDKYVIDLEGEKYYNLKIYNYNNELVFESNDKNNNWDGINFKNGQLCNSGIYYGILDYKISKEEKNITRMTKIKLIR